MNSQGTIPNQVCNVTVLALMLLSAAPGWAAPEPLEQRAQDQIALLQEEKSSRTPDQQKLDSQILYSLRQNRLGRIAAGVPLLRPSLQLEKSGLLLVDMNCVVSPGLLQFIKAGGGTVVNSFERYGTIRAELSLAMAESLSKRNDVRSIRPADEATLNTTALLQGDVAHAADQARAAFLVNGSGVKVGVLSDSVDYLNSVQKNGALPSVTILPGQSGIGNGEGTAMLEIVHSLAPGSDLYFATAFGGVSSFAQNIRDLYAAGCRIIIDDVLYFNEPAFQDGPIAQAVNDVSAGGALFFSSAGNCGGLNRNTAGTWEGDFNDGGPATIGRGGRLHDFGGVTYDTVIPGGSFQRLDLFWSDPLGRSTNDYDVYILDANGNVLRSSTNIQNGQGDPYESLDQLNTGERIVIVKQGGDSRFLHLTTLRGRLQFVTSGSTYGHNASGAQNAFSVAATQVSSPAQPFSGGAANPVESFGSDGPRRVFFNPDGSAITPGNFGATGGRALQKPDITAADGVATTVPSFPVFFGTSAAAPHAGAIAALLWSYNPALSPPDIRRILTQTALDIAQPGWDRDSGAGITMAYAALKDTLPQITLVEVTDANNNGSLDPNECADILVTLSNRDLTPLTGISGILSSSDPSVVVDPAPRLFPDLPPGGTSVSTSSFRISTRPDFICGSNTTFVLRLSPTNHDPFEQTFQIASAASGLGPVTTSAATDVPLDIPDLGTAESSVSIQGMTLPIARVRVSVFITHTYDQDLQLSLIGPDKTEVLLSGNNGFSGQNYGLSCSTPTVFADDATASITLADPPFAGTYIPQNPLSAFTGKGGSSVNGVWTLRAQDTALSDTGTIQCWSLEVTPITCFDGGGQCLVPPGIAQNPQDALVPETGVAQFEVVAQGTQPLSYQWYFNQTNLLTDGTNAILVLSNVSPAEAGGYSVSVSNPYGSVQSQSATLTVIVLPTITCASNLVVELGSPWDFSPPTATGSNAVVTLVDTVTNATCGLTYSAIRNWVVTDANNYQASCSQTVQVVDTTPPGLACAPDQTVVYGNPWGFTEPTVQDLNTFIVTVLSTQTNADCGNGFTARRTWQAMDGCGNIAVCAQTVQVVDQEPPLIVAQPQSQQVLEGQVVSFEIQLLSCPPLTYQWYLNDTNLLADATNATLVLSNLTESQAGQYLVIVSNNYGSVTSEVAELSVLVPAAIISGPTDLLTTNGSPAELTVFARGTGPLFYQWHFNGTIALADATNAALDFAAVEPSQAGTYTVVVSNFYGSVTSAPAVLTVFGQPAILSQPADVTVNWGGTATFEVSSWAMPDPAFQWLFNGTNYLVTQNRAALTITNVQDTDAGAYSVLISNAVGTVISRQATLTVQDAPAIDLQPSNLTAMAGDTVFLTVQALGKPPLSYQWYADCNRPISGATANTLRLKNVTPANDGTYCVSVSNAFGTTNSLPATVRVLVEPKMLSLVRTNGVVALTFRTATNFLYSVSYKADLRDSQWTPVSGAIQVPGTATSLTILDSSSPASRRYYEIQVY